MLRFDRYLLARRWHLLYDPMSLLFQAEADQLGDCLDAGSATLTLFWSQVWLNNHATVFSHVTCPCVTSYIDIPSSVTKTLCGENKVVVDSRNVWFEEVVVSDCVAQLPASICIC